MEKPISSDLRCFYIVTMSICWAKILFHVRRHQPAAASYRVRNVYYATKLALTIYTRLHNLHRVGSHVLLGNSAVAAAVDLFYIWFALKLDHGIYFLGVIYLAALCVVYIIMNKLFVMEMIRVLPLFPGPVVYFLNTLLTLLFGVTVWHIITCATNLTEFYRQSREARRRG